MKHSGKDLFVTRKFLFVQPWNTIIIWVTKYLIDPSNVGFFKKKTIR